MLRLTQALALLLALTVGFLLGYRQGREDTEISIQKLSEGERQSIFEGFRTESFDRSFQTIERPSKGLEPVERLIENRDENVPRHQVGENEMLPKTPLDRLVELLEAKRYAEAMEMLQSFDFGEFEPEALELRAKVAYHLALEWMSLNRRGEAKDLLSRERNLKPKHLGLLEAELQWYKEAGLRPDAIKAINHVLQFSLAGDDRDQVLSWRHQLMVEHLKLLSENDQWREMSDFLSGDPAPGDKKYYRYQLWAARAHTELFEFSQAKSALDMAAFDADLLGEVELAQSHIEKLQKVRHDRVSLKGGNKEVLPIGDREDVGGSEDRGEWKSFRATWIRGSIIVNLKIGNREFPMLLDTGASITSMDQSFQSQLAGEVVKVLGNRNFHTANGITTGEVVQLDAVQMGPFSVSFVDVAFMNGLAIGPRYVGLLGMNVLRYFDFQFDEIAGVVRMREKP